MRSAFDMRFFRDFPGAVVSADAITVPSFGATIDVLPADMVPIAELHLCFYLLYFSCNLDL